MAKKPVISQQTNVALTSEEVIKIPRNEVRYALRRMISGNHDAKHDLIFKYFEPRLKEYGLDIHDFSTEWDVAKDDWRNIVSGHIVRQYQNELNASLFNSDGKLKK